MLARARRSPASDAGFSLIELMVVVLIIAILLAIAVPTFLGARSRAQNRAAQSNLRTGLTAEKTLYTDSQAYQDATTMATAESSLSYVTTTPTAGKQLEVAPSEGGASVCLIAQSASGNFYGLFEEAYTGGGWIAGGTYYAMWSSAPACPTGSFSAGSSSGWYSTASAASW